MNQLDRSGGREPRRPRVKWLLLAVVASAVVTTTQTWNAAPRQQGLAVAGVTGTLGTNLSPTLHPVVPVTLDSMWFVPTKADARTNAAIANLARGITLLEESADAAKALPLVSARALANTDVAPYARYYTGVALQQLNRLEEAEAAFASVAALNIEGHLPEAAAFRHAEVRAARRDYAGAQAIHERLVQRKTATPHVAWVKLGMMAEAAGDRARAVEAFDHVLQEFPLAAEAIDAELGLERINGFALETPEHVARELVRAETLFKARRIVPARAAYTRARAHAAGENRDLITLRLTQLDALDGKHRAARDVFRRFAASDLYREEAEFALLASTLGLGEKSEYRSLARSFVDKYPAGPFTEDALADLARHYVLEDEDGEAARIYAESARRFPAGKQAERAFWKAGWWAYRQNNYQETVRLFEQGAANFPRSDYRPSWLYWSARAYDGLGDRAAATERYRLAATDYLNTYYGRLAWRRLEERSEATVTPGIRRAIAEPPPPPPTIDRIARLIELELYYPALAELQHAQKMHGDSAPLLATVALVHHKLGNLRPGIQTMKRAYPQYMTAGGEQLPTEILQVLFPLDYWPLIQYHARANGLDPYLVAALVGQESTFDADIVSSAKAIGLMQIMPPTGRQYAKKLGIKPFSTHRLTEPEVNVRIGTYYFAELIEKLGGAHYALAAYNAGDHRVARWTKERGPLPQDEFIDDIPYPETQNYIKRILGTAEDYRRLYGSGLTPSVVGRPPAPKPAATSAAPAKKPVAKKPAAKRPAAKKSAVRSSTRNR